VDRGSKEIVQTPSLQRNYKVVNDSRDLLEVQGVTVEYLDGSGTPIVFQSGDKTTKASLMTISPRPRETSEGTLDVTFFPGRP
jgi:hypothetical protein